MARSALIIGATGLIGKIVLPALIAGPTFSRVGEFGRRVTPGLDKTKLVQKTIDFENINQAGLKDETWDVVYITLGTTKAIAGGKEAFTRIDKEYVVNAAREARIPGKKQTLVYLSSAGASLTSHFFYTKSKAQTEEALSQLGYDDFIALRPAMFVNGDRSGTSRASEGGLPWYFRALGYVIPTIDVQDVATAVRLAGELGTSGIPVAVNLSTNPAHPHTVLYHDSAVALAKSVA